MLRLIRAGLIAGCMQVMAVAAATAAVMLSVRHGLLVPASTVGSQTEPLLSSTAPFLTWIDLLTALGVALTENRRSEEHTSELQSLMRTSYAVFCLKKKNKSCQEHSKNRNTH